jgi:3-phosphoshikimate 1-carboxyvinyltransferase
MHSILLKKKEGSFNEIIRLAASKSESNRALILNALCGFEGNVENLASARDTQTMIRLLKSNDKIADVLDAGTTMRFLTAYYAISGIKKTMTGTERMCQRPIGILVEALRELGADIQYLGKEGFPPLAIEGFKKQNTNQLTIRGDVSSQFISALLMVAPILPNGLTLNLTGEVGSIPYIKMTLKQMEAYGVNVLADWENFKIEVLPQKYIPTHFSVESDWSGASYWYSVVALAEDESVEIELIGLKENSLQGDSVIVEIMKHLGVNSTFTNKGVLLKKISSNKTFEWDFTHCPDLAQTVAVIVTAKHIPSVFTGLESLKVKETDRVLALQNELSKIGGSFIEVIPGVKYELTASNNWNPMVEFETYEDHRMAMAFAPLSLIKDIVIKEPSVVAKSYPSFWDDLGKIIEIKELV